MFDFILGKMNKPQRKKFSESTFDKIKKMIGKNIGQKYLDLYESLL